MAELASGAVTSLLGVIRNEWRLLGRVGGNVQFIREEMESMNSFLMHLARTAPPGSEHDEQVRTWMNQVRLLANDCNNCIDLYLYRGNPDIHLGKDRIRRYLRWVPWFLQKIWAQHRAALELSELKERARDVGQRRLRYGVEVPKKAAASGLGPAAEEGSSEPAFIPFDDDEDDGQDQVGATATDGSDRIRRALFGIYTLEDYFNEKLTQWIKDVQPGHDTQCAAFLVPSTADSGAIAREATAVAEKHVKNTILVDIPALHIWYALGPKNILYYILREIKLQQDAKSQAQQQQQQQGQGTPQEERQRKWSIRKEKRLVIQEIKENIKTLGVVDKLKEITTTHIKEVNDSQLQQYLGEPSSKQKEDFNDVQHKISQESSLGVLLILLLWSSSAAAAAAVDEMEKKAMPTLADCYDDIIKNTAQKLKEHMDQINKEAGTTHKILHNVAQYEHILRGVFPTSASKRQQAQEQDTKQVTTEAARGKNQIREIVDKVKQEILSEVFSDQVKKMVNEAKEILEQLKEYKSDKQKATDVLDSQDPTVEPLAEETKKGQLATNSNLTKQDTEKTEILDARIEETKKKMGDVQRKIERQLHINGIIDKIQSHLNEEETLIILNVGHKHYVDQWEQTRNALNLLPGIAVAMILTKTKSIQQRAKEQYCYPSGEPIDYSLAALYHEIMLAITSQHNYDSHIFRTILDKCESNQLCMKIFARALYAKPKRSEEDLHKLHKALEVLLTKSYPNIAMKMFKFSYRDMPKDYQSCLLYLAIFPQGYKIRRSTLIGRWVAEGMITTEDWRWSSSVDKAEQCFDALVTRGLVYSAETDISATGRVKSCMVGDLVHEFITKIAKKQRIVEARLSYHLARHFSIFNDLHLRSSEKIVHFLERLSESSQWSRIKVLDLEGCKCFMENRHYLKNICNNILLLKYLSLRGTDVNWLPSEINNLRELEVLDIQRTEVPEFFTRGLLLLKLKRLLAGNKKSSPNSTGIGTTSLNPVLVPRKIEKMLDMEVLSNVKAKISQDLIDIGKLWQLRKLGVVIEDKVSHLNKLLQTISDLHECLRSLSITLGTTKHKGTPSIYPRILNTIKESPKVLERLSISGNILHLHDQLLPCLTDASTLIKVTLSNTSLSQDNLVVLAKLHMLRCLKLRHNTYSDNKLTFKKDEFKKLKYFLVEGSNWIEISFEDTAAPELEKIVLSFDNIESIAGVDHLKKLEELELNKYNKSSNNSGGNTDTAATNQDPSALAGTSAANLSSHPPAAAAATVANDPIPSTPIATDTAPSGLSTTDGTANPTLCPLTATAAANNLIPSTSTATGPVPSAPTPTNGTANRIPSPPTAATITNDRIPSTPITIAPAPTDLDGTANHTPCPPTIAAAAVTNDLIPSTLTASDPTLIAPTATDGIANPTTCPPITAAAAIANDPSPSTPTTIDPAPFAPTATNGTTNPTSCPPTTAATTVANDLVPSTPTATDPYPSAPAVTNGTANPTPCTTTAAAVTNDPIPSTPTATDPSPSAPAATNGTANPTPSSTTTAAVTNDPIPSTPMTTNTNPSATAGAASPSPSMTTTSDNNMLLPKLISDAKQINKVTLRGTMLKQNDLRSLASMESIRCLVLLHESYDESQLDLNKNEFPKLNSLIVNCSTITRIKFEHGSSPKLEKIVWTFANMNSFSGIENLPRLKEIELKGDSLPNQVKEDINKHKDRIYYTYYKPESQDQTERNTGEVDRGPSSFIWKNKGWCWRN